MCGQTIGMADDPNVDPCRNGVNNFFYLTPKIGPLTLRT